MKSNLLAEDKLATILDFDKVLGLDFEKAAEKIKNNVAIPENVQKILNDRDEARKNKDWKKSDELRNEILRLGYEINDTDNSQELKPLNS